MGAEESFASTGGKEEKGGDETHDDAAARKATAEGRARPWYMRTANNNATTNQ